MAQPSFGTAGTAGHTDGTTNPAPGLPASTTTNDILLVVVMVGNSNATCSVSGYTEIGSTLGTDIRAFYYWKRAGSSESAPSVSITNNSNHSTARCYRYTGCLTTGTPFEDATTTSQGNSLSCQSSTVTPTGDDRRVVCLFAIEDDSSLTGYPPTNWNDRGTSASNLGTDGRVGLIEYTQNPTANSDVSQLTIATTAQTEYWSSCTLCLLPTSSTQNLDTGTPPAATTTAYAVLVHLKIGLTQATATATGYDATISAASPQSFELTTATSTATGYDADRTATVTIPLTQATAVATGYDADRTATVTIPLSVVSIPATGYDAIPSAGPKTIALDSYATAPTTAYDVNVALSFPLTQATAVATGYDADRTATVTIPLSTATTVATGYDAIPSAGPKTIALDAPPAATATGYDAVLSATVTLPLSVVSIPATAYAVEVFPGVATIPLGAPPATVATAYNAGIHQGIQLTQATATTAAYDPGIIILLFLDPATSVTTAYPANLFPGVSTIPLTQATSTAAGQDAIISIDISLETATPPAATATGYDCAISLGATHQYLETTLAVATVASENSILTPGGRTLTPDLAAGVTAGYDAILSATRTLATDTPGSAPTTAYDCPISASVTRTPELATMSSAAYDALLTAGTKTISLDAPPSSVATGFDANINVEIILEPALATAVASGKDVQLILTFDAAGSVAVAYDCPLSTVVGLVLQVAASAAAAYDADCRNVQILSILDVAEGFVNAFSVSDPTLGDPVFTLPDDMAKDKRIERLLSDLARLFVRVSAAEGTVPSFTDIPAGGLVLADTNLWQRGINAVTATSTASPFLHVQRPPQTVSTTSTVNLWTNGNLKSTLCRNISVVFTTADAAKDIYLDLETALGEVQGLSFRLYAYKPATTGSRAITLHGGNSGAAYAGIIPTGGGTSAANTATIQAGGTGITMGCADITIFENPVSAGHYLAAYTLL